MRLSRDKERVQIEFISNTHLFTTHRLYLETDLHIHLLLNGTVLNWKLELSCLLYFIISLYLVMNRINYWQNINEVCLFSLIVSFADCPRNGPWWSAFPRDYIDLRSPSKLWESKSHLYDLTCYVGFSRFWWNHWDLSTADSNQFWSSGHKIKVCNCVIFTLHIQTWFKQIIS